MNRSVKTTSRKSVLIEHRTALWENLASEMMQKLKIMN
jgi:hypothetical protein